MGTKFANARPTRRGWWRVATVAALGAAVTALLLSACASGTSAGTTPVGATAAHPSISEAVTAQRTVVHSVQAYRSDGHQSVPVANTVRGSCFTASIAAAGSDTYRCIAGNSLLDPCVAAPTAPVTPIAHPKTVACLTDPWSPATVVQLTSPLPALPSPSDHARPWALQLADGTRCVAVTGTVPQSHGVAMTYACADGSATSTPRAASTPPTATTGLMHVDHLMRGESITRVAVVGVWRI